MNEFFASSFFRIEKLSPQNIALEYIFGISHRIRSLINSQDATKRNN